jgi:hypothetical protein
VIAEEPLARERAAGRAWAAMNEVDAIGIVGAGFMGTGIA